MPDEKAIGFRLPDYKPIQPLPEPEEELMLRVLWCA